MISDLTFCELREKEVVNMVKRSFSKVYPGKRAFLYRGKI